MEQTNELPLPRCQRCGKKPARTVTATPVGGRLNVCLGCAVGDILDVGGPLFDYGRQAWVMSDAAGVWRWQRCGHPTEMMCGCYGREHAGEELSALELRWIHDNYGPEVLR